MIGFVGKNVKPSGAWRFLALNEPMQADDLTRETNPWSGSDYVDHDDFKRMNWATVKSQMPAWIGKTLEDFYNFGDGIDSREVIRKIP